MPRAQRAVKAARTARRADQLRSAAVGSMRDAARAGSQPANSPTAISTAPAPASMIGSRASTRKSRAPTNFAAQRLRPMPSPRRWRSAPQPAGGPATRHRRWSPRAPCGRRSPAGGGYRIRADAVETERRQQQRQRAEESRQHRDHPVLHQRGAHLIPVIAERERQPGRRGSERLRRPGSTCDRLPASRAVIENPDPKGPPVPSADRRSARPRSALSGRPRRSPRRRWWSRAAHRGRRL